MKRLIASAVLAWLLMCAGCFTTAPPKIADPEPMPIAEPKAPPPVMPDQINAQNAQEKAQGSVGGAGFRDAPHGVEDVR